MTAETVPEDGARSMFDEQLNALARQAASGERAASDRLIERIRPAIVRYCRARIGRTAGGTFDSSDDVAQDACLGIFVAIPSYRDKTFPFMALAYRITANKVADHFRKRRMDRTDIVDSLPEVSDLRPDPEELVLDKELGEQLHRLLGQLADKQREILVLRLVVGMSAEETATALGTSSGAIRVAQHRALQKLRSLVGSRAELVSCA